MVTSFELEHTLISISAIQTDLLNTFFMGDVFVTAQFSLQFETFETFQTLHWYTNHDDMTENRSPLNFFWHS